MKNSSKTINFRLEFSLMIKILEICVKKPIKNKILSINYPFNVWINDAILSRNNNTLQDKEA